MKMIVGYYHLYVPVASQVAEWLKSHIIGN